MKLEEVLPALRKGKKIRRSSWLKNWDSISSFSIYANEPIYGALDDDWEIDPEPKRVADYFVPIPQCELLDPAKPWFRTVLKYQSTQSVKVGDIYYRDTYAIGEQPKGSVMIPGSERNEV